MPPPTSPASQSSLLWTYNCLPPLCAQAWKPSSQHAGEKRGVAGLLLGRTERAARAAELQLCAQALIPKDAPPARAIVLLLWGCLSVLRSTRQVRANFVGFMGTAEWRLPNGYSILSWKEQETQSPSSSCIPTLPPVRAGRCPASRSLCPASPSPAQLLCTPRAEMMTHQ